MSIELEDNELHQIRSAFARCDEDGSGTITVNELESVYKALGHLFSVDQIKEMMVTGDLNADGNITFNEFLSLYKKQKLHEIKLREAFKICDCDGNSYISLDELKMIMNQVGGNLSDDQITSLLKEADIDGDGNINFEEFIHLTKIKHLF